MKGLIFGAEKAFPEAVVQKLPPQCIKDVQEAGKSIAFDLPTACGFHIFRALETVVLMYFPVLEVPLPDERKRNLGTYILILEGKDQNGKEVDGAKKVDEKITGMLRHLKDSYRNPLMHPELTLEDEEAESLFQFAISAITQLIKDIKKWTSDVSDDEEAELIVTP